jgi:leucine dehydrogenase
MPVFDAQAFDDHEQVLFVTDSDVGLRGIIAIHDTTLGPALGGCRMWPYESESAALRDVLRLSRGMTYKGAAAGVKLGGGKAVIIGDPRADKTPELLKSMAQAIERLNGQYITGPDIGTSEDDMNTIRSVTRCVIGVGTDRGGYGDPSASTAQGVFQGIRAALNFESGATDLQGVSVAVQGLGHVGYKLCRILAQAGAELVVSDIRDEMIDRAKSEFGVSAVPPDVVYECDVDVYAPCAFGAVINDQTLPKFKARIIAGAANNQLDEDRHGEALQERGIIYLPDYVVNGGGLIRVAAEWYREDPEKYNQGIDKLYDTCLDILQRAKAQGISTSVAADRIAEERLISYRPKNAEKRVCPK